MIIRKKQFDLKNNIYIMGILNVTPDSFSDGGAFNSSELALKHTEEMIAAGADIIDIGGESTRPSHTPLSESEEIDRVIPIIEAVRTHFDIPISIDTYKAKVGKFAVKAGADMINDIWGFKKEPELAKIAAEYKLPCCLMHNRNNHNYTNIISNMLDDFKESITIALDAGVSKENIILDPGIGFAKTSEDNLIVMNHLDAFQELKYPLLLGTSRKSFIGNVLNLSVDERVEGTLATTVIGIIKGCSIIRVHDVLENKRAAQMTVAILKG